MKNEKDEIHFLQFTVLRFYENATKCIKENWWVMNLKKYLTATIT